MSAYGPFRDLSEVCSNAAIAEYAKSLPKDQTTTKNEILNQEILSPIEDILLDSPPKPKSKPVVKRNIRQLALSKRVEAVLSDNFSPPLLTPAKAKDKKSKERKQNVKRKQPQPVAPPIVIGDAENLTPIDAFDALMGNVATAPRTLRTLRRNFIGEMAARAQVVGSVDLVSSPLPRINEVINVDDSDDEGVNKDEAIAIPADQTKTAATTDFDFDVDNPPISVKIIWNNGKPEAFDFRLYQKFDHIFSIYSERTGCSISKIVFNLNEKFVLPSDTPASINYRVYEFINGRVLEKDLALTKKPSSKNLIKVKIQSNKWKRPLEVSLTKTENLKMLYIKCAEELKIPYKNFKLKFDDTVLEMNETPSTHEMEGGELIDLYFK